MALSICRMSMAVISTIWALSMTVPDTVDGGVQWMTHREEGGRLMVWAQGELNANWRVGSRLIWQASQQSTFRFELQATWER